MQLTDTDVVLVTGGASATTTAAGCPVRKICDRRPLGRTSVNTVVRTPSMPLRRPGQE